MMALQSLTALATTMSKEHGEYPYKVVAVPFATEIFKLCVSACMLWSEIRNLDPDSVSKKLWCTPRSIAMAAVPGVAYQLLNNLNFVTLYYLDAPTYQILSNLKIVGTGIAGYCMLGRRLTRGQWGSLLLLTLGSATTQLRLCDTSDATVPQMTPLTIFSGNPLGYLSAAVCVCVSATLGVYTEMFMKGSAASIHWQNFQLYIFGVIANGFVLVLRKEMGPGAATSLFHGFNLGAALSVAAAGGTGLAVSFLLRYADSIVKTYASVMCIPFTALVSFVAFGTAITSQLTFGSATIIISLVFYFFGAQFFILEVPKMDVVQLQERSDGVVHEEDKGDV
eukprot:CAMPEP_0194530604 /NCGR_PEP_ID=MMETSP0253-20130528/67599_1 /TAXON_ID=2966 /ORGANISM="Noctiluca scintillans" /LENGTH=336 /DNA_ID=CAMNT_0039375857 /DNA_START=110 /DNA_END=1120 /DNA_ORIENTATION=-